MYLLKKDDFTIDCQKPTREDSFFPKLNNNIMSRKEAEFSNAVFHRHILLADTQTLE